MAGLLDGLVGDNTTQDQYGQTQADRRDPIWSGLIRAGLLAVAGGGNLMPEQRAQYLAQAGGAIADIPKEMQGAAASAAQQKLRGQQLDEGKRKVADRDRVRALMQNPEMAQIVANAKGADKIAIQAAIETGDMGALNTAISNLDKSAIAAVRNDATLAKIEAAKAGADAKAGRYKGTNERLQHLDNLEHEDPGSQKYWAAWTALQQEMKGPDGTIIPKMDLVAAGFKPPTFKPPGGTPSGYTTPEEMRKTDAEIAQWSDPAATVAPPKPIAVPAGTVMSPDVIKQVAQGMKPGDEQVVNGVTVRKNSDGTVEWEPPEGDVRYKTNPRTGGTERQELKPMPEPTLKVVNTANYALGSIEQLKKELENPQVEVGTIGANVLPGGVLDRTNPQGIRARALIAGLTSQKIKEMSGAAVSEPEFQRLDRFLPKQGDNREQIAAKLIDLEREFNSLATTHVRNLGDGYRVLPEHRRFRSGGQSPAPKVLKYNETTGQLE